MTVLATVHGLATSGVPYSSRLQAGSLGKAKCLIHGGGGIELMPLLFGPNQNQCSLQSCPMGLGNGSRKQERLCENLSTSSSSAYAAGTLAPSLLQQKLIQQTAAPSWAPLLLLASFATAPAPRVSLQYQLRKMSKVAISENAFSALLL